MVGHPDSHRSRSGLLGGGRRRGAPRSQRAPGFLAALARKPQARARGIRPLPRQAPHCGLVRRPWDDKSKYLASAGFTLENPEALEAAIRDLASTSESHEDGINEYGVFWRTEGLLKGPLRTLPVVLIWLQWTVDGTVRFVTLKPQRVRE